MMRLLVAISSMFLTVVFYAFFPVFNPPSSVSTAPAAKPPNIVFILTDDQDVRHGSLNYMQNVQNRIVGEGVNFLNHFGTVALW